MKILKAGTLVQVKKTKCIIDIKEYIGHRLYQGNDIKTNKSYFLCRNEFELIREEQ
jgi:hypothetical protein